MKTDLSKATPRPWTVKCVKTSSGQCFKLGNQIQVDGNYGAICVYDDFTSLNPRERGNAEADAALIVKAVNEFDALNAVVEAARNYWNSTTGGNKLCGHEFNCVCAGDALRDTLAALDRIRNQKTLDK